MILSSHQIKILQLVNCWNIAYKINWGYFEKRTGRTVRYETLDALLTKNIIKQNSHPWGSDRFNKNPFVLTPKGRVILNKFKLNLHKTYRQGSSKEDLVFQCYS